MEPKFLFMTVVGRDLHCLQCLSGEAGKIGCKKAKNTDGRLFEILKWIGILLESYPAEKWFQFGEPISDITCRTKKAIVTASVSTHKIATETKIWMLDHHKILLLNTVFSLVPSQCYYFYRLGFNFRATAFF